jgi:hypothetical protein
MLLHDYPRTRYYTLNQVECRVDLQQKIAWINIPKNSSTMINGYLKNQHWSSDSLENWIGQANTFLIVLRDPVDRWASGITEYMYRYHPNVDFDQITDLVQDIILQHKIFDEHTFPQVCFLDTIPLDQCVYFRMDQHLVSNFQDYLQRYCNVTDNSLQYTGRPNDAKNIAKKQEIKDFFVNFATQHQSVLEEFYEYDTFLYNSVTYYQSPMGV